MKNKKNKILIIKIGHSETLDPEISNATSYGDVLRSTVLLNLYKNDHVTWLVDEKAYPILKGNPYIDRILIYDLTSALQLQSEHFDTVINLEKVPGICALADQVTAWRRHGFRFDVKKGEAEAYDGTENALSLCQNEELKRNHKRLWQEHLFEMVGGKWNGETYQLGYKPKSDVIHDIGFNYQVGNKWPLKAWPMSKLKQLEKELQNDFSVSWQRGIKDMEEYFEWINSCKLLVTNDSFGLHVALALKKNVIALFGPTHYREHYLYGLGKEFHPENFKCDLFPCHVEKCIHFEETCMELIEPIDVATQVRQLLKFAKAS